MMSKIAIFFDAENIPASKGNIKEFMQTSEVKKKDEKDFTIIYFIYSHNFGFWLFEKKISQNISFCPDYRLCRQTCYIGKTCGKDRGNGRQCICDCASAGCT